MAKKIPASKVAKAKKAPEMPTTGDGRTMRQRPQISETNLPGRRGFVAPLIRRMMGGKHQ